MKRNILVTIVFYVVLIIPLSAFAEEAPFEMGDPVIMGSGCPSGSYRVYINRDGDEISIYFSEFSAMTDDSSPYDFANCNVAIPIKVPSGISVGLAGVDHRGAAYIPSGGKGVLMHEQFFTGQRGDSSTSSISTYNRYYNYYYPHSGAVLWSKCGDDVVARSNSTIYVTRPMNSSVDAQDHGASIRFYLQWKECN
jgi:hypothetical protein